MITKDLFDKIKMHNGSFASWAVWEAQGDKPKSNMGPDDILDLEKKPKLLDSLRNYVIMVGLNFSRALTNPKAFANFHDRSSYANDFKIRYAFQGTSFWGAI